MRAADTMTGSAVMAHPLIGEAFFRLSSGIALFDRGDRLCFANQAFLACYGLSAADLAVGQSLAEVMAAVGECGAYGSALGAELGRQIRSRQSFHKMRVRSDGRAFAEEGEALDHGYLLSVIDVTEKKRKADQLWRGYKAAVVALADLAECRDQETGEHVLRVATLVHDIAIELRRSGYFEEVLTERYCRHIATASILHDVGKVVIPDSILRKPGPLDAAERKLIETHAEVGGAILEKAALLSPESPYFQLATEIAVAHHERWDGKGYPAGLAGEAIPLSARVAALADVFDALISERPYKPAWPLEKVIDTIRAGAGTQFDERVVQAFLAVMAHRAHTPLLTWSEDMSVGEPALDRDHRSLIGLLNQLAVRRDCQERATVEFVLDELVGYTLGHFNREEAYLHRIGYPQLDKHQRVHQALTKRLHRIRDRVISGAEHDITDEVLDFLASWLRNHILKEDRAYRDYEDLRGDAGRETGLCA